MYRRIRRKCFRRTCAFTLSVDHKKTNMYVSRRERPPKNLGSNGAGGMGRSACLVIQVERRPDHRLVELDGREDLVRTRPIAAVPVVPLERGPRHPQAYTHDPVHRTHGPFDFVRDLLGVGLRGHHVVQDSSELTELYGKKDIRSVIF